MHRAIFIALAILGVTACASHSTKTVLLKKPDAYAANTVTENFVVGAEAYDTDEKTKAAFDQRLVRKGIYPVQIAIENTSQSTLLILRDQIELTSSASGSIRPMNSAEVAESVEANAIAHAVLGFGIFSYGAAQEANAEREADYANKQMAEEVIVRPGRMEGGFVFFRAPTGEGIAGRRLVIPVEDVSEPGEATFVEIQL